MIPIHAHHQWPASPNFLCEEKSKHLVSVCVDSQHFVVYLVRPWENVLVFVAPIF